MNCEEDPKSKLRVRSSEYVWVLFWFLYWSEYWTYF